MNYVKIDKCSTCNGLGFRVVLWVAGCEHHCKCCHNPQTWDKNVGKEFGIYTVETLLELLNKPYIKGLTISGGDPLMLCNRDDVLAIAQSVKSFLPEKDIWVYTGYKLEEIEEEDCVYFKELCKTIDVLVDGKFEIDNRDITLPFKGSTNQRTIDIKKTLNSNEIVLL